MAHSLIPEAEKILDKPFPVLDKGFVRLVDYLGGDDRIVQAARVSYGKGTKTLREDKQLIDYLLRNGHTSPFEQVVFTFHAKMPLFVARQWVRHRSARINEISGRYSEFSEECYLPELADIALQSSDNKQGREEKPMPKPQAEAVREEIERIHSQTYAAYKRILDAGTARELARIVLPVSLYTQWYWQIDLHNLFHFLELRLDSHAQREIRAYAKVLLNLTKKVCPLAVASFERHSQKKITLTSEEGAGILRMLEGGEAPLGDKTLSLLRQKLKGQ